MARRRKKRPLRPRVPSRVKRRTRRPRSQHENELLGLALARTRARARGDPLSGPRRRRGGLVARRGLDGDRRQWCLRPPGCARRARWAPARAERPPRRAAVPARRGGQLPRSDDAARQGLRRLDRDGHRWLARRADRRDRGRHHRWRAPPRRAAPRDGGLDRRDPSPDGTRRAPRRNGCEARVRVAVERVSDAEDVDLPETAPVAVQHRLLDGAQAYPDVVGPSVRSEEASTRFRRPGAGVRERGVRVRDVGRAHGVPAARPQLAPHVACGRHREDRREREDRRPARHGRSRSSGSRRPSWARSRGRA